MTGIQETIVLGLREIAAAVEAGKYGTGDDIDVDAAVLIIEDVETMVIGA